MAKRRSRGEGSLIQRKGCRFWYAQYYDHSGKPVRVSTKTAVKQEAFDFLRREMSKRDEGVSSITDLKKVTYGTLRAGLLANYVEKGNKSLHTYADGSEGIPSVKPLDKFFGFGSGSQGVSVLHITTDKAREFAQQRQAEGMGNAIINRSLAALRRMMRLAHEEGKIRAVPVIRLLKEPPARKGFVLLDKFKQLVGALPSNLHPLITFLYYCGGRKGEAFQIEWSQVDLKKRTIRLEEDQTKGAEARYAPLPAALVKMLEEIEPKEGKVFDSTNLTKEWRKACVTAGLGRIIEVPGKPYDPQYEGLMVHDLRRSAISNLVNAGVPERVAMKISGHKTRAVFDRYHIVSTDDISSAMLRLESAQPSVSARTVQKKRQSKHKLLKTKSGAIV